MCPQPGTGFLHPPSAYCNPNSLFKHCTLRFPRKCYWNWISCSFLQTDQTGTVICVVTAQIANLCESFIGAALQGHEGYEWVFPLLLPLIHKLLLPCSFWMQDLLDSVVDWINLKLWCSLWLAARSLMVLWILLTLWLEQHWPFWWEDWMTKYGTPRKGEYHCLDLQYLLESLGQNQRVG